MLISSSKILLPSSYCHQDTSNLIQRKEPHSFVSEGLTLQNAAVADSTKLAIWQNDIGKITQGNSYYFRNFVIKTFQGEKYIQWPKQGAEVKPIEDIESTADDASMFKTIAGSEVVGVSKIASYQACISCKNKVTSIIISDSNGTCTNCGMKQKLARCPKQLRATMIVTTPGGGYLEVTAFGKHLKEIAGTDRVD